MTLSRRSAWFLVLFALWNAYVWITFVANVYPMHHWDSFFIVHVIIGTVTVVLGGAVGFIGLRRLRQR